MLFKNIKRNIYVVRDEFVCEIYVGRLGVCDFLCGIKLFYKVVNNGILYG